MGCVVPASGAVIDECGVVEDGFIVQDPGRSQAGSREDIYNHAIQNPGEADFR